MDRTERRTDARLSLAYPIRIHRTAEAGSAVVGQTVTRDLSARGAYFATFDGKSFDVGQTLGVAISVPHRLGNGGREVILDLRGRCRVVRVDRPGKSRMCGENGYTLTGVALKFDDPLQFRYAWV